METKNALKLFSKVIERAKWEISERGIEDKKLKELKSFFWKLYLSTLKNVKEEKAIGDYASLIEAHIYRTLSVLSTFVK